MIRLNQPIAKPTQCTMLTALCAGASAWAAPGEISLDGRRRKFLNGHGCAVGCAIPAQEAACLAQVSSFSRCGSFGAHPTPEVSGITATELELAAEKTRWRVETIAEEIIGELQQRGLAGRGPVIPEAMATRLIRELLDWQFGAGPLEPLFREPDVEDIIVNSAPGKTGEVAIEVWTYRQSGKRREVIDISADDVREIINRNAGYQGRALNPTTPILNAQMRNGARIIASIRRVLANSRCKRCWRDACVPGR